jgi:hypothetical protein
MLATRTELFTFRSLVGGLTAGCQFPGMIWRFAPSVLIGATFWRFWTFQSSVDVRLSVSRGGGIAGSVAVGGGMPVVQCLGIVDFRTSPLFYPAGHVRL